MKILVTGAAGFIGAAVTLELLKRGDEVIGLDNCNDYYDPALKKARLARMESHPAFEFVEMDCADQDRSDHRSAGWCSRFQDCVWTEFNFGMMNLDTSSNCKND